MAYFQVTSSEGFARSLVLELAHGKVETPVFMPVGTYGAVKAMSPLELEQMGTQILLSNTYHLFLRPGLEVIESFSDLHTFMNWKKPILTDSGGFQAFSLSEKRKITDEGIEFVSHLNGDKIFLTPELCAKIQQTIGSDIAMILDECVALPATPLAVELSIERTLSWTKRFLNVPRIEGQKIFGIVQGGLLLPLRKLSLEATLELNIDGLAIGGLSVGESFEERVEVLESLSPFFPPDKPRYLMGVGTPLDLIEAVRLGVDMFDCVLPTRNARNGYCFTSQGPIHVRNQKYKLSDAPLDPHCLCETCRNYSLGYIRHLFVTQEMLGSRVATHHNLFYYQHLMKLMRENLRKGTFNYFYRDMKPQFKIFYGKELSNDDILA